MNTIIHDPQTDDRVCTNCGVVQQKHYYFTAQNISYMNSTDETPTKSIYTVRELNKLDMIQRTVHSMICPEQVKEMKLTHMIQRYSQIMGFGYKEESQCERAFKKYPALRKMRPQSKTIAATLVVIARIDKRYVHVQTVEKSLSLKNLTEYITDVCKILGINQRVMVINAIPSLISYLMLPFNKGERLKHMYQLACRKYPSLGAETRMALCCYKLLQEVGNPHGFTIDMIADLNNTTTASIKGHLYSAKKMQNKKKCSS